MKLQLKITYQLHNVFLIHHFPPLYYYLFVIFFVMFCPFTLDELAYLAIGIYSSKKKKKKKLLLTRAVI